MKNKQTTKKTTTDKQLKKINDKQEKVIDILPNLMYRNTILKCPL